MKFIIVGLLSSLILTSSTTDKETIKLKVKETFYPESFRKLDISEKKWRKIPSKQNRDLWLAEIEYPFKTNFTSYWDDYSENQYRADRDDFLNHYKQKKEVLYAIIQGPNWMNLWAYSITTVKQIDEHYILSNSYFRHNRFTYKAIAILDKDEFNEFTSKVNILTQLTVSTFGSSIDSTSYAEQKKKNPDWPTSEINEMCFSGYLIDNVNNKTWFLHGYEGIRFMGDPKVEKFYEDKVEMFDKYFDQKIKWETTYEL